MKKIAVYDIDVDDQDETFCATSENNCCSFLRHCHGRKFFIYNEKIERTEICIKGQLAASALFEYVIEKFTKEARDEFYKKLIDGVPIKYEDTI